MDLIRSSLLRGAHGGQSLAAHVLELVGEDADLGLVAESLRVARDEVLSEQASKAAASTERVADSGGYCDAVFPKPVAPKVQILQVEPSLLCPNPLVSKCLGKR